MNSQPPYVRCAGAACVCDARALRAFINHNRRLGSPFQRAYHACGRVTALFVGLRIRRSESDSADKTLMGDGTPFLVGCSIGVVPCTGEAMREDSIDHVLRLKLSPLRSTARSSLPLLLRASSLLFLLLRGSLEERFPRRIILDPAFQAEAAAVPSSTVRRGMGSVSGMRGSGVTASSCGDSGRLVVCRWGGRGDAKVAMCGSSRAADEKLNRTLGEERWKRRQGSI